MARPPQFEHVDDPEPDFISVRAALKRLSPRDRARILAWLCLYYDDAGERFGIIKRRRIAPDGMGEHWLVKVPRGKGR